MHRTYVLFLLPLFISCGDSTDRPEDINKIRGLGLNSVPLVNSPSNSSKIKTVDLTVYFAAPKEEIYTIEKFTDQSTSSAFLLNQSNYDIVANSQKIEKHSAFNIISFQAIAKIPTEQELPAVGGKVRVGFKIIGSKNTEIFIGDFLVVPESNTKLLNSKVPSISLTNPITGTILQNNSIINVKATPNNVNEEDLIVGWFVSSGEITNRRSINTYWETKNSGQNTLIVTLRGKKSLGFAMQILDFTVQ